MSELSYISIVWIRTRDIIRFISPKFLYSASLTFMYIATILLIAQSLLPLLLFYTTLAIPMGLANGVFGACLFLMTFIDVAMICVFQKFSWNSCVRDEELWMTAQHGRMAASISLVHPTIFLILGMDGPVAPHWSIMTGIGMLAFMATWGVIAKMKWELQRIDMRQTQEAQVHHAMETCFDQLQD
ncbi:hypothetical protein HDU83_006687 [Entophlyctis luteolus]|nr:hypothetical protein HDU83_006687 [Entophlyctis luteolus]